MSTTEFLNRVLSLVTIYKKKDKNKSHRNTIVRKNPTLDHFLYEYWDICGVSGGSWSSDGESNHYITPGEPEPEFTSLDIILLDICPELSYLQYKSIARDVIKSDTYTEGEYYNNSTSYGIKKVILKDLYDKLQELSII